MPGFRFAALFSLGALLVGAQDLGDYEKKATEFTLANGLHFIVLERHEVPVISFHTYVNAGSAEDPAGQSGMAHMLERMAFKGTETIGSRSWTAEKKALEDLDAVVDRLQQAGDHGVDAGSLAGIQADISVASEAARGLEDPGEFLRILEENGAVNISCHATPDSIETSYSLPSNRIELWFLMESQRLAHPAFREFYAERDRLVAEISSTLESRTALKLEQKLLATAFEAEPYRNPVLGWSSDAPTLRRATAKAFFETYFVPGNMVVGIVGDVDPGAARLLAERYFGPLPAKPLPPAMHTAEPQQYGPKSVAIWARTPPMLMIAYKRPGETQRDDVALDAVRMVLGEGRTSWMYKELVDGKKIAQDAQAVASVPAARHVNLFVFEVTPAANHTVEENRKALDAILARFQAKPVDAETLTRVKNIIRGRIARLLGSNQQLAALLPTYYVNYGNWRRLFTEAGEFNRLTPEDLQRVAAQYFVPTNRTEAWVTPPPAPGAGSGPGGFQ